jgi:gliding motility-associated-like protein
VQGLSQGQYSVTVTDAHGCSASSMGSVSVVNPTLQVTYTVGNSICGGPSGSISISSVLNGTAPYSFVWATGQTAQNLSNLSPGIYVVDVTDNNGCSGSASMQVDVTSALPVKGSALPDYCDQKQGSANVIANGNPPYQYAWSTSPVQTTQAATNLPAGDYVVLVTDAYNCKDSITIKVINQNDLFVPSFSTLPQQDISSEEPVTLQLVTNGGWNFNHGSLSDGTLIPSLSFDHIFAEQGDYSATYYFTSVHGCKDTVTYTIHVKDEMSLFIPTAYTPNHDGMNDEFKAKGFLIQTFEMNIYDRWGNLVIKLNDINEGWNGKFHGADAEPGTYVYKGIATNQAGEQKEFHGQIQLIK